MKATRIVTLVLATLALVASLAFAATADDHVRPAAGDRFIPGTALREDFVPLPGQESLPENAFLNSVRANGVTGHEDRLLDLRDEACTLIEDFGYSPDSVAGFFTRTRGMNRHDADVVTVAAFGSCDGSVIYDALAATT